MYKHICILGLLLITIACSTDTMTADEVKEQCLADSTYSIFYGEQKPDYCDCVYNKLKESYKDKSIEKSLIDSVKLDCDLEYTTLDTNF